MCMRGPQKDSTVSIRYYIVAIGDSKCFGSKYSSLLLKKIFVNVGTVAIFVVDTQTMFFQKIFSYFSCKMMVYFPICLKKFCPDRVDKIIVKYSGRLALY